MSTELLLTRPGQTAWAGLMAGEIGCSWSVKQAGALSARVRGRDLTAAGISDPLGYWVRYDHPTAGTWGGVVTDQAIDLTDGTVELAARSFHALTEKRRTARNYQQSMGPAGSLALRAIADVNRDDASYLASWQADETGDPVKVEWRGDDLGQVLTKLAQGAGQEWTVDADRNLRFRTRLGTTRDDVLLVHGYHIAGGTLLRSLAPVVNDLLAVSGSGTYRAANSKVYEHAASIRQYGRRQGTRVYANLRALSALDARAQRDVRALATPPAICSLEVIDVDGCWTGLREGDVIWVAIPVAGVQKRLRILARALDVEAKTLTITGPLEAGSGDGRTEPLFEEQ